MAKGGPRAVFRAPASQNSSLKPPNPPRGGRMCPQFGTDMPPRLTSQATAPEAISPRAFGPKQTHETHQTHQPAAGCAPSSARMCPQPARFVPPRPDRPRDNSARHRPEITPSNPPNPPRGELTSCPKSAFRRPPRPLRPTSACVERAHMQHSFVHGRLSMTIEACTHPPTSNTQKTPLPLSCALCAIACYAWLT